MFDLVHEMKKLEQSRVISTSANLTQTIAPTPPSVEVSSPLNTLASRQSATSARHKPAEESSPLRVVATNKRINVRKRRNRISAFRVWVDGRPLVFINNTGVLDVRAHLESQFGPGRVSEIREINSTTQIPKQGHNGDEYET